MDRPYRWPDPVAEKRLNELLALPAHGQEQNWEIELADSSRLDEMLKLFTGGDLDLECRSALALLILFSLTYHHDGEAAANACVPVVREALQNDAPVRNRMLEYWGDGFLEHETAVSSVLT